MNPNLQPYYQQPPPQQQQPPIMNMNMATSQSMPQHQQFAQMQQAPGINNLPGSVIPTSSAIDLTKLIDVNFSKATSEVNNAGLNSSLLSFQSDFSSDEIQEPVSRCKEIFPQLKTSVQNLIDQLSKILQPQADSNRNQLENQFLNFGKNVENFNKLCDLLIASLKASYESQIMANELRQFYRYYSHIDMHDAQRTDLQMINSVNIQMQRVNDLKQSLKRFTTI